MGPGAQGGPEARQAHFRGMPTDVRAARRFVADALGALGLAEEVHRASLATSELVSNVINHVASGFTLRVNADAGRVTVEVHDPSPVPPRIRRPGPSEPAGRGLQIVEKCTQAWGTRPADGGGKVVWFEIARHAARRPGA